MFGTDTYIAFLPLFIAFWCVITLVVSIMGGWFVLAKYYRATQPFNGTRWHFRSASVHTESRPQSNYAGVLTLGANSQGLYISVLFPFRIGHPPLFIPWSEVESSEPHRQLLFSMVQLNFKKAPSVSVKISRGLAHAVAHEAHGCFVLSDS